MDSREELEIIQLRLVRIIENLTKYWIDNENWFKETEQAREFINGLRKS